MRYNDGTGLFTGAQTAILSSNAGRLTLNDIDGDGDLDVLAANGSGNRISIRLNQPVPAPGLLPAISRFAPDSAAAGSTVTVTGTRLGTISAFTLHGVAVPLASISNATDTGFRFVVPAGAAATGAYSLTAAAGTGTAPGFVVRLRATSFSPTPNAVAVPVASALDIAFTEPVTVASAAGLRVYSAQAGGRKAGAATVSGNTVHFAATPGTPYASFRPGEEINVSVPGAVQNSRGLKASRRVVRFTAAAGGTGKGYMQPGTEAVVLAGPYSVTLGDVDGDGDLDLVTANPGTYMGGYMVSVRLNGGDASGSNTGTFTNGSDLFAGGIPISVVLGDIDGDGDLDLLIGATNLSYVQVYLNSGTPTNFFSSSNMRQILITVGRADGLTLADIDGDGDLDMLACGYFGNSVSVRLNGGDASGSNTGMFSGNQEVLVADSPCNVLAADVDGDGDLDFITSNSIASYLINTVSIRLNGGDASGSNTGIFSDGSTVEVERTPLGLALGDVDGDGDIDFVTANAIPNSVNVRLNGGDASGSNTGLYSGTTSLPVGFSPRSVALADVDGDGDLDVITADREGNTISTCLNNGHGVFGSARSVSVGTNPNWLTTGDIDGDGDIDVLTANQGGPTVSVRLNGPSAVLATQAGAAAGGFLLAPNPARGAASVTGVAAYQVVRLYDVLGREVAHTAANATSTAHLALPAGLAEGVYVVRAGTRAQRLVVE